MYKKAILTTTYMKNIFKGSFDTEV